MLHKRKTGEDTSERGRVNKVNRVNMVDILLYKYKYGTMKPGEVTIKRGIGKDGE
jgi:hypothetical protein